MLSPIYSSGSSSKPAPLCYKFIVLNFEAVVDVFLRIQVRALHFCIRQHQGCRVIRLLNPTKFARWSSLLHLLFLPFFAMVVYKSKNSITIPARQTKAYKTAKEFRMLFILILQVISAVAFSVTKVMPFSWIFLYNSRRPSW